MKHAFVITAALSVAVAASSLACSKDQKGVEAKSTRPGELTVGSPAPDFSVKSHDGTTLSLSALKGKHVVLYFYPKDETPGCTKQACALRDSFTAIEQKGTVLIGVSGDSDESHKKFAENHKLPFSLVSDPDGKLAAQFGVPFRMGFASRQTIVIDPQGRIKKIYRDVNVGTHAQDVLGDVS